MEIDSIIIAHYYAQGSAATNRIVAYAKSFFELGKRVLLVLGSRCEFAAPYVQGVDIISVIAPHFLLARKMAQMIKRHYDSKKSAVLVYGSPVFCLFLNKARYNVFYECTEIPLYGRTAGPISIIKEHVKLVLAKRSSGMLVISRALKDYFSQRGIKNLFVVNMFVDYERFSYVRGNPNNEKYIAYCGTISPFKDGVDCLIEAFSFFVKECSDYKLVLIGRFENIESEKLLRGMVEDLGIEDRVLFTGMISPDEMPMWLSGARMLALARPNNEQAKYGFPTKLGEYLATGKPVVVTSVGEIGDFLVDGKNCRLAIPGNPSDFAQKMVWVETHYEEALRAGEMGRMLTRDEFSRVVQAKNALLFIQRCSH